ncbi:hypothetical protein Tco_1375143, partial [Tanacetum coccineum]
AFVQNTTSLAHFDYSYHSNKFQLWVPQRGRLNHNLRDLPSKPLLLKIHHHNQSHKHQDPQSERQHSMELLSGQLIHLRFQGLLRKPSVPHPRHDYFLMLEQVASFLETMQNSLVHFLKYLFQHYSKLVSPKLVKHLLDLRLVEMLEQQGLNKVGETQHVVVVKWIEMGMTMEDQIVRNREKTRRMELYIENRENGRMILDSVLNGPLVWPTGLPPDVYAIVNHHKVLKEIWDRVNLLMQGKKLSLQEKECKLDDEFDKFSFVKGETLYQYY